jgi:hypothetical protein
MELTEIINNKLKGGTMWMARYEGIKYRQSLSMNRSFIYGHEKGKVRQKGINKDIVLCQRHYGGSRVTACGCLQSD